MKPNGWRSAASMLATYVLGLFYLLYRVQTIYPPTRDDWQLCVSISMPSGWTQTMAGLVGV